MRIEGQDGMYRMKVSICQSLGVVIIR